MTNISRRSIAKGAAWSVPAVTMASAAPALAASDPVCQDTIVCPATPMTLQGGSSIGATLAVGNGAYPKGTYYSLGLGQWNTPPVTYTHSCTGQPATRLTSTGYRLNFAAGATNVTSKNGTAYQGTVTSYTPTTAQTAGAGLSISMNLQTSVPFNGQTCDSAHTLGTVSLPFTITYLQGLTPLNVASDCKYYLNLNFKNATACSPQIGATYTITKA